MRGMGKQPHSYMQAVDPTAADTQDQGDDAKSAGRRLAPLRSTPVPVVSVKAEKLDVNTLSLFQEEQRVQFI